MLASKGKDSTHYHASAGTHLKLV